MPWVRYERGHRTRTPGRNIGPGGRPTPTEPKRCAVCGREFSRQRYVSGMMETVAKRRRRVVCSQACAAAYARRVRAALAGLTRHMPVCHDDGKEEMP